MSYKSLEVWQLVKESGIDIHNMTMSELHQFEIVEEDTQIGHSVKLIKSTIDELHERLTILGKMQK